MTKIVGILNITPDSFSDGGKFLTKSDALAQAKKLIDDGAKIIDIGAQSTRPDATRISQEEEFLRLEKILPEICEFVKKYNFDQKLRQNDKILVSLDSFYPKIMAKAVEFGIDVINDVEGLENEEMVEVSARSGLATILMHGFSLKNNDKIIVNQEIDVVEEIYRFALKKSEFLQRNGVKKSQIIFDPGIGFHKTNGQSLRIVKNLHRLKNLGFPLFVGHSKKRFLDEIFKPKTKIEQEKFDRQNKGELMSTRAFKTQIISAICAFRGVEFIRVHDVAKNLEAIQNWQVFAKKFW